MQECPAKIAKEMFECHHEPGIKWDASNWDVLTSREKKESLMSNSCVHGGTSFWHSDTTREWERGRAATKRTKVKQ